MPDPSLIGPSRKESWKMFDQISSSYDRVNRIMTSGCDRHWRKKMVKFLPPGKKMFLLDLATGTADQLLSLVQHSDKIEKAIGLDLSKEMLEIGKRKIAKSPYASKLSLQEGSALEIPYEENSFDCITLSFGMRNFSNTLLCLREIFRTLKKEGRVLILEASLPHNPLLKKAHLFYLRKVMPRIGGWISKNRQAYVYLNETIETFPSGNAFCDLLREVGFIQVQAHPLMWGAVTIYQADKF